MKVCIIGLHLVILGLSWFSFQAYGQDNSTQMYYLVLTIDADVWEEVQESLISFSLDSPVRVDQLTATTNCEASNCTCLNNHVSSGRGGVGASACSSGSHTEHVSISVTPICQPTTRVTIKGWLYLNYLMYFHAMADPTSDKFKQVSDSLITKMKPSLSTLQGFDDIHILEFRRGLYAKFEVYVNRKMSTEELKQKVGAAVNCLNATVTLETEGLVDIQLAKQCVPLGSTVQVVCTSFQEEASSQEWWQTTRTAAKEEVTIITNGTESNIMSDGKSKTTLTIRSTSAIWTGLITCIFKPAHHTGSVGRQIAHSASVMLDVALLPNIEILSEPQFPKCTEGAAVVPVTVKCEIKNSTQSYVSHWIVRRNRTETAEQIEFDGDPIVFTVETAVGCLDNDTPARFTCVFKNTQDQTREAMVQINVILSHESPCEAVDDWPDTKPGFTAKVRCEGKSGVRLRPCTSEGTWGEEESQCVNNDLSSIITYTTFIDKGLGSIHKNSDTLFSRLANATNVTESINTVSNVNTSIIILDNMQKINTIFDQSSLDNILKSSNNILNIQHPSIWNPDKTSQASGNASLAETYLLSVEMLLRHTNISHPLTKEESNIHIRACRKAESCDVFNATVSVDAPVGGGLVKAAGFKNLIQFLPLDQRNAEPNSIVVTVSVDDDRDGREWDVAIRFRLTKPRPRNHGMQCVAMDDGGQWSFDRCDWGGPSDEGLCRCRGSSAYGPRHAADGPRHAAYATVLSKNAIDLPALREITYVGLAFSIVSILAFLAAECLVWKSVVKTNSLYLRHTALVNIAASLLVGDSSLLASTFRGIVSDNWCQVCVVLQHFFYLAQFFWMFCLSMLLLYQAVFMFEKLGKGRYQCVCYTTGYGVPFVIVTAAFVTHDGGAEGSYYDAESCWLTHRGLFKGSFYSFIIPVGIIVFFNLFSMALVIIRVLNHPKGGGGGGGGGGLHGTRRAVVQIMRSIVVLTPVFGVTWIFGFATLALDLAAGTVALVTYYTFSICNSLQGFFILLAVCVGEKTVRDALRKRICRTLPSSSSASMETTLTGKDI